ncbi:MAG TPA: VOC family protein [Bryobacteraceae bacterium]|nr:VOC family protein [Bryobacteraceae bacterium]
MTTRREILGLLAAFGAASRPLAAEQSFTLDHFKLRVADLDRSVAFYFRLFGGPLAEIRGGSVPSPPDLRAVFFKIGSGKPYMILSPPDPKVPVGLEHVAVDAAAMTVVKEHRLPLAFPPDSYVRDPDGNLLEFVGPGYWSYPNVVRQAPHLPDNLTGRQPIFEPLAIQRVALRVSDRRRAAGFYSLFGIPDARNRSFDFRGTALDLVPSRQAQGLAAFTVVVRNFDVASARQSLRELGITPERIQRGLIRLRDPDGNLVEVVAPSQ